MNSFLAMSCILIDLPWFRIWWEDKFITAILWLCTHSKNSSFWEQKHPQVLHNLHIRYLNILGIFTKWRLKLMIQFNHFEHMCSIIMRRTEIKFVNDTQEWMVKCIRYLKYSKGKASLSFQQCNQFSYLYMRNQISWSHKVSVEFGCFGTPCCSRRHPSLWWSHFGRWWDAGKPRCFQADICLDPESRHILHNVHHLQHLYIFPPSDLNVKTQT